MKNKKKKNQKKNQDIHKVIDQIIELEKQFNLNQNPAECVEKMAEIANNLSFDEMILIDEYLMKKFTK